MGDPDLFLLTMLEQLIDGEADITPNAPQQDSDMSRLPCTATVVARPSA